MKFNFNRYIQILKSDLIGFRQKYLAIILAALLVALLRAFMFASPMVVANFWTVPNILLIILIPFVLYEEIYHKTKGVSFALLPASLLEKFLTALTHCLIIVPAIVVAITFLVFGIVQILEIKTVIWDFEHFFWEYADTIAGQVFLFWVVFWFRKNKKRNGLFVLIGICLFFILASRIYLQIYHYEIFNFQLDRIMVNKFLSIFKYTVFPLIAWSLSYYKFTRQQV